MGSNLDVRKWINNARVYNNQTKLDKMPREHIYRLIQRRDEQLKAKDRDFL